MIYFILCFLVFAFFVVAIVALKLKARAAEGKIKHDVSYVLKPLFSPAERSFFGVLELLDFQALTIASKVRLADIFEVKKGLDQGDRRAAQNKINMKHVDYLLVQKSDGKPVLGIELDDISHQQGHRAARDAFVDTVFSSATLPILHVPAKHSYDLKEIRRLIDQAMSN